MDKRWKLKPYYADEENFLQSQLKIHPLLCRLLVQRNIKSYEDAFHFFRPSLEQLHDPMLMKDMDKAINRIAEAISAHEKILIYGDYDVDGTTAVSAVYSFLQLVYTNIDYYIPNRYREGYGISYAGIDYAKKNNISLVIALDCGIKAVDKIKYAQEKNIDFIICDHHLPDQEIPPAIAVLNPQQKNCPYPYKELSGCGIGFKLMTALSNRFSIQDNILFSYLDLVAVSIAADIVPITGENRILAYFGLKQANENPQPGIAALKQLAGLKKQMHIGDLVFIIAPRINAAGRMDDAAKVIQLFTEKDQEAALQFAEMLHNDNNDRKEVDTTTTEEALAIIKNDSAYIDRTTTVLYQSHWHKGVIGIVASRLIETYYRPTIILTQSNDRITGSARSVQGFNLYEAIHECRDLLENYGGHFYAAGMTLRPENIEAFAEKFEEVVRQSILPEQLIPEILIDTEICLKDIKASFYNIIKQFEPFGPENLRPVFMAKNLRDTGYSKVVKNDHIRFEISQSGNDKITGIGFNLAQKFPIMQQSRSFDACFTLDENEWNGSKKIQLKVLDIRPAENQ